MTNWTALGELLMRIQSRLTWDGVERTNEEERAETVRLLVAESRELLTEERHQHSMAGATTGLRMDRDRELEVSAALRRDLAEARRQHAAEIRDRCNDRTVPARLRREGVLLAADWLDPTTPKES